MNDKAQRPSSTAPKPTLRVSLTAAQQLPRTLVPTPPSPAKSMAGAILEGSHTALFSNSHLDSKSMPMPPLFSQQRQSTGKVHGLGIDLGSSDGSPDLPPLLQAESPVQAAMTRRRRRRGDSCRGAQQTAEVEGFKYVNESGEEDEDSVPMKAGAAEPVDSAYHSTRNEELWVEEASEAARGVSFQGQDEKFVGDEVEDEDTAVYSDEDARRALTLEELLKESRYILDSQNDFGGPADTPAASHSALDLLHPAHAISTNTAGRTPLTLPAPLRRLVHSYPQQRSTPIRCMSAPASQHLQRDNASYQQLLGSSSSEKAPLVPSIPNRARLRASTDTSVHPAYRSTIRYVPASVAASARSPHQYSRRKHTPGASTLRLSVRQRIRSSAPRRETRLLIPPKSTAERAASSDSSPAEKAVETVPRWALDFDDEALFVALRHRYRQVLCGSFWRRYCSARTLKRVVVTNSEKRRPTTGETALGDLVRRPSQYIARNARSDRSYEKALMQHYRTPERGAGRYAWVQWARRVSIVGAIDVEEESIGRGRRDRLLPEESGTGELVFVEGFAAGRIAAALTAVLILSIAGLVVWTVFGPGGEAQREQRVGPGALLALFALVIGWAVVAFWVALSWVCG